MNLLNIRRFLKTSLLLVLTSFILLGTGQIRTQSAEKKEKVNNVIFMVPDGFSTSYATNYRLYKGKDTMMDSLLVGMHRTYSANSHVTDSAAAATAMATGVKTNNGMISISPDGKKLKTILEAAKEAGKKTGLVATSTITYATPAAFASHVASRTNEKEIAKQYLDNEVDVILGGGKKYFSEKLIKEAKSRGYSVIFNGENLKGLNKETKLLGLFSEEGMAPELDRDKLKQPSVSEMTKAALDILNNHKKGFFLMVEGSQIDWAGHSNDAAWAMKDIEAFEAALKTAIDFAKKDKNTLVVIAGDHDTGGMSVGAYEQYATKIEVLQRVTASGDFIAKQIDDNLANIPDAVKKYTRIELNEEEVEKIKLAPIRSVAINHIVSKHALVGWTTLQHTGVDVPLYAYGPHSERFRGLHENTALPVLMAEAMQIKFSPSK